MLKEITFKFISAVALGFLLSFNAYAGDIVVIANMSVNLAADEVREVFLGDKQFAGKIKLTPVDNAALQDDFISQRLKISDAKYTTLWTKKAFRDGLTPPALKSGDAEVIEYVKRTKGAVGYVSSSPSGVNIVK